MPTASDDDPRTFHGEVLDAERFEDGVFADHTDVDVDDLVSLTHFE
jgi:hypothetical protein